MMNTLLKYVPEWEHRLVGKLEAGSMGFSSNSSALANPLNSLSHSSLRSQVQDYLKDQMGGSVQKGRKGTRHIQGTMVMIIPVQQQNWGSSLEFFLQIWPEYVVYVRELGVLAERKLSGQGGEKGLAGAGGQGKGQGTALWRQEARWRGCF